jgi:hypothetical protein
MFSLVERIRKFASTVLPSFFGQAKFSIGGNAGCAQYGSATIHLSSDGFKATVNTDENGDFKFTDLSAGSYTITPALSGHFFTPTMRGVEVVNEDVLNADFVDPVDPPVYSRFGLSVSIQNYGNRH